MKYCKAMLVLFLTTFISQSGLAQPTNFNYCYGSGILNACQDELGGLILVDPFFCPTNYGIWEGFKGRVAFGPFKYVGPITVEVDAFRDAETDLPLYVEYIPVNTHPSGEGFCDGTGLVFMTVFGRYYCDPPGFESRGPIVLNGVADGDLYYLRLHFLVGEGTFHGSPFVRCVRIRSVVEATAVTSLTWTVTKQLYR
jgi:hypothetical protein